MNKIVKNIIGVTSGVALVAIVAIVGMTIDSSVASVLSNVKEA